MSQMISDVQNYLAMGSIGGYVALALYGSVVLFALIGLLKGLSRGILRQTVRTLTVGLSAICSFVLCQKVYPTLAQFLDGKKVSDVITELQIPADTLASIPEAAMKILNGLDAEVLQYILAAPLGLILLPFVFVLSFIVISAAMLIVHGILCAILGFKKERNNGATRFLGMLLGLAQGAAVGALLFLPVLGLTNFLAEPVKTMDEGNTVRTYYEEYAEPVQDAKLADVLYNNVGGKMLLEAIGTLQSGEETIKTQNIGAAALGLMDDVTALKGVDIKNLTKEQEAAIDAIIAKFENQDDDGIAGLSTILVGVLKGSVTTIQNDPSILPLEEGDIKNLVVDFVDVFSTVTADSVSDDLGTIAKVLYILSDNGVLADMSDPAAVLTKPAVDVNGEPLMKDGEQQKVVYAVITVLNSNETTKCLVDKLTSFAFSMMAPDLDIDPEAVKEDLCNVASVPKPEGVVDENGNIDKTTPEYETYKENVSNELNTLLANNGLDEEMTPEVQEQMGELVADYLLTNDVNPAEISTEQMAEIFLTYLDASKTE